MFTGIIEECGILHRCEDVPDAKRLTIYGPVVTSDANIGDSIAVNGVCLTVIDLADSCFTADVMQETLYRTSLGQCSIGQRVNLERAVAMNSRLGGHIVQGHVDTIATITAIDDQQQWSIYHFQLDQHYAKYIVSKGSVAIDGVSLTVVTVDGTQFSVSLIPATRQHTILGEKRVGDIVNIEVDVLAKYVEKLGGFTSVNSSI